MGPCHLSPREFEIGVAYKVGLKCPNQDIFGTLGRPKSRWPEIQMARSSDSQYDYMSLYIYKKCCNQCYTGYTPNVLSGPTPFLPRALPIVYYTQQYYIQLYIGAGYEKKHGQVSALSPPLTHYLHGLFPKFFFYFDTRKLSFG